MSLHHIPRIESSFLGPRSQENCGSTGLLYALRIVLAITMLLTTTFIGSARANICIADNWCWENPQPQGNQLNGFWGSSSNSIFAVGEYGTILRFDGSSWSQMNSATTSTLSGIWGSDENDIFAVGKQGMVIHYDGSNWTPMTTILTQNELLDVWGTSSSDIFAVGTTGLILHFDGSSWSMMETTDNFSWDFRSVWGSGSDDVFAVGDYGKIYHYDGNSWSPMDSGCTYRLLAVWGVSENDVYAVGSYGTILHFDGNNWSTMSSGINQNLTSVWGTGFNDIYAVGSAGMIVHFDGNNWSQVSSGSSEELYEIFGDSNNTPVVAGSSATILTNSGNGWFSVTQGSSVTSEHLVDVWGTSSSNVFAVGMDGGIYQHDGLAWTLVFDANNQGFEGIWGSSINDVFAVGWDGIAHFNGSSWSLMDAGTSYPKLLGIWGSGRGDVFGVGHTGTIMHYDGNTWTTMNSGTTERLYGVWGSSENNVYAVGENGTILRYDGVTWSTIPSNVTEDFQSIWGSGENDIYISGLYNNPNMMHFDGTSWSEVSMPTFSATSDIWGSSSDNIYAVGTQGTIQHFDGENWSIVATKSTHDFYGIWGNSCNDIFITGVDGTVIHKESGNGVPELAIISPAADSVFSEDDGAITFSATANDPENGDLSATVIWASDKDGAIVSPATLSVGTHSITATVSDSCGNIISETISVTITSHINTAPSVSISFPADNAIISEDDGALTYVATATDIEDGDLSSVLAWSSNIDGGFSSPAQLSAGAHTITATVTDSGGLTGSDAISLTVTAHVNVTPTLAIVSPLDGSSFSEDAGAIVFSATANDQEDGDISGGITWASDIDGSFTPPAPLTVGTHTVTATVIDSGGLAGSAEITLTVTPHVNLPPQITITHPSNGTISFLGEPLTLSALADDPEEGDLSGDIAWNSDIDGYLGQGSPLVSPLSLGSHTLTTTVIDSEGLSGSDSIDITIEETPGISVFPYTEGFEGSSGDWENSIDDQINWANRSGSTPSGGTGPTGAHGGTYYMYVEASYPNYPNKAAVLNGPLVNLGNTRESVLSFWYHMYGLDMGTLSVEVSENEQDWTTVWSLSGDQGTAWQIAYVDLTPYCNKLISIRFRGTTGGSYRGDMSIDDITVDALPALPCSIDSECDDNNFCNGLETCLDSTCQTGSNPCTGMACNEDFDICEELQCTVDNECNDNNSCTLDICDNGTCINVFPNRIFAFPYYLGFESDFGTWINQSGDNMDWTRKYGSTSSSGTGPSSAQEGTYYAYMESSSPNYPSKTAIVESPSMDLTTMYQAQLSFWYHMYGTAMGSLYVEISDNCENWSTVHTISGNQGDLWQEAIVDLTPYTGQMISLRFRGVTGSSYTSDISIDAIRVDAD